MYSDSLTGTGLLGIRESDTFPRQKSPLLPQGTIAIHAMSTAILIWIHAVVYRPRIVTISNFHNINKLADSISIPGFSNWSYQPKDPVKFCQHRWRISVVPACADSGNLIPDFTVRRSNYECIYCISVIRLPVPITVFRTVFAHTLASKRLPGTSEFTFISIQHWVCSNPSS